MVNKALYYVHLQFDCMLFVDTLHQASGDLQWRKFCVQTYIDSRQIGTQIDTIHLKTEVQRIMQCFFCKRIFSGTHILIFDWRPNTNQRILINHAHVNNDVIQWRSM